MYGSVIRNPDNQPKLTLQSGRSPSLIPSGGGESSQKFWGKFQDRILIIKFFLKKYDFHFYILNY